MGPFEKIRKQPIYDIHGSAFACKDLIFSFPGGGVKSVRTLGGGQEKYSLQQGRGQNFQFFCIHTLWTTLTNDQPTFQEICDSADVSLFRSILQNPDHVLHQLLPPVKIQNYSLCEQAHNREIPFTKCYI